MTDWQTANFFIDQSINEDPYPYYDELREQGAVVPLPHLGVVAVTGYEEANDVYRSTDLYSSCISVIGPFAQFPVPLEGDDIGPIIDAHRGQLPMNEHMVTMDPPMHTQERSVLMRLLTPKRLKENEEYLWDLSGRQLEEFVGDGKCEFIRAYTQPFAMLAVADVLGVPQEDHERFRAGFGLAANPGELGAEGANGDLNALGWLDATFSQYIEDRREHPRKDVLTDLAQATYPDGSVPPVENVVRSATFLFAAGQETTARLLAASMKYLAENPDVQVYLRDHPDRIPDVIEETLRIESPVKADFRLAKRTTTLGGVPIPAGTPVMLLNGAANRDPQRFECPADFKIDREGVRQHMAFGRGVHSCPGGPLARVEGRISLERILARTRDIRLSEEHHGAPGDRHFTYEPTWVLRGLNNLHIEFTPID